MIPCIWAIYERPKDYPDGFIARKWDCTVFPPIATEEILTGETLHDVRLQLSKESIGKLPRFPTDDPCLVEVWL